MAAETERNTMSTHISTQFDQDLDSIFRKVLGMGGLVEEQLRQAIRVLSEGDTGLVQSVLQGEQKTDTLEMALDEETLRLLVRRQPAAGDLRLVMAIIKAITDLERIGDEAEKVAKMAQKIHAAQGTKSYYMSVLGLGNHVCRMLREALDAFARMDLQAAVQAAGMEPESNHRYAEVLGDIIDCMRERPDQVSDVIHAVWMVRSLERVADHASNLCEYVIYSVEGKDVRHTSLEKIRQEVAYLSERLPAGSNS